MGWFDDETGAERAARIKGENQAAEHARKRSAKQEDHEKALHAQWSRENAAYKRAEYQADLAAWKRDPSGYERQYDSPADVRDLPGEPFFVPVRDYAPTADPDGPGLPPIVIKIGVGCILVFFVLPALFKMVMPVVGAVLNTVWLIILGAAALLTVVWLVLKLTAGEDPVKVRRAQLLNPVRIGTIIYQVAREYLAERRARKIAEK